MAQPLSVPKTSVSSPVFSPEKEEANQLFAHIEVPIEARVVLYDNPMAGPVVSSLTFATVPELLETLPISIFSFVKEQGGTLPFTVIKEITDNFIHADFSEITITITDGGKTVSFSDQGPGIANKEKALLPGFTSASKKMKPYIRGVGFGLCMAHEFMEASGGSLTIEDNIAKGTVITLVQTVFQPRTPIDTTQSVSPQEQQPQIQHTITKNPATPSANQRRISKREQAVFSLFKTYDEIGPTIITQELGLSLGTAARTLDSLENAGLIYSTTSRKRILTDEGMGLLYR